MEVGRVEAIVKNTEDTIPSDFIWSEKDQPSKTTLHGVELEIPVIALDETDEDSLVKLIAKASSEIGLFQVINHGIPKEVIENLQKVGKEFFELPLEEKEKYGKLPGSIEGYGTSLQKEDEGKQGKKGWNDHIFHRVWPPSAVNPRCWPQTPASYKEANVEYAKYLRIVADKLFRCLSLGLGLEEHELKEGVGGDDLEYLMKINYYPPCPRPDLALGVPAHTDMSALTLLIPNEVPGLQLTMDNKSWYNVQYIPNAIIVHIGDQIEIMSNGKYKAVNHRTTVCKDKTRISWPVFLEPPAEHVVGPNSKLVSKQNPAEYKRMKYCDYAAYTYSKYIEISKS